MTNADDMLAAAASRPDELAAPGLSPRPRRKVAVLSCMDTRIDLFPMLGIERGDAHIIRNAGGIVTEDALRSLIISHHLLGTEEFLIINHTDCGMLSFRDEDLQRRLEKQAGTSVVAPSHFHAFQDLERNVQRQVERVRSHPWIPRHIPVRGFVYDVKSGELREVPGGATTVAA